MYINVSIQFSQHILHYWDIMNDLYCKCQKCKFCEKYIHNEHAHMIKSINDGGHDGWICPKRCEKRHSRKQRSQNCTCKRCKLCNKYVHNQWDHMMKDHRQHFNNLRKTKYQEMPADQRKQICEARKVKYQETPPDQRKQAREARKFKRKRAEEAGNTLEWLEYGCIGAYKTGRRKYFEFRYGVMSENCKCCGFRAPFQLELHSRSSDIWSMYFSELNFVMFPEDYFYFELNDVYVCSVSVSTHIVWFWSKLPTNRTRTVRYENSPPHINITYPNLYVLVSIRSSFAYLVVSQWSPHSVRFWVKSEVPAKVPYISGEMFIYIWYFGAMCCI